MMTEKRLQQCRTIANAKQEDTPEDVAREAKRLLSNSPFGFVSKSDVIYYMKLFAKWHLFKRRCEKCGKRVHNFYDYIQFRDPKLCIDCIRANTPNTYFEVNRSIKEFV
jgi:hypothetical protein